MPSNTTDNATGINTRQPDPWSDSGYAQWQGAADIRKAWMKMMGMDDQEIDEHCKKSPPTNIDDELAEYNAMFAIQEINSQSKCER